MPKSKSSTSNLGRYAEIPEIEITTGGYWLKYRFRSRFVACSRKAAKAKRKEFDAYKIIKAIETTRIDSHNSVKTVYYRDEEGKICIPPNGQVPQGFDREEVKTLSDADRICREMSEDLRSRFDYDATEHLDHIQADKNGNLPRDIIVSEMQRAGSYGKEVAAEMLKVLDQEERDRHKVSANVTFSWRES